MSSLFLGYDAAGRRIRLSPKDRRTHMHVMGSSGSGKSKFLEWMIRGDVRNRQGFCLLDPHGTLYDDVVKFCAHKVLSRDIILLNLSKPSSIVGFNPFRRCPRGDVSVQVDGRINATMHAWNVRNTDETPTLARTLRLIYTILIEQNLVLSEAKHLINFEKKQIRANLVERLANPLIQQEWEELQKFTRREWRDEVLSVKNRLYRLLTLPVICRFTGVHNDIMDLQEIMDQGKILLVNLRRSDDLSEENARVFGALLVSEFFEAAFRREKSPSGEDPAPYHLYLDEFQNFVSLDIADMLDQVRKFGLFMVLAHQRFGQIDENVAEAALSHCRLRAVFGGLTVPNARRMAEEMFIGKLDSQRVKVAIYQTKFWPVYDRDTVYTNSTARATSEGAGEHSGAGTTYGSSSGESFQPADWFGSTTFNGMNTGSSDMSGNSHLRVESETTGDSEADIPIFRPVPFKELSSVQHYTPEEQLIELTAALKNQYQRHCFIQIHDQDTQPMLVPVVEDYYTPPRNLTWYDNRLLQKAHALPTAEVDRLLQERDSALLNNGTPDTHDMPRANSNGQATPNSPKGGLPDNFYE